VPTGMRTHSPPGPPPLRRRRAPNKHHNIPSEPADALSEGGSVDDYPTHVCANSMKTAYIDPRDRVDLLQSAFNDIQQSVAPLRRDCGRLNMTRLASS
jgi:hypothetical protein